MGLSPSLCADRGGPTSGRRAGCPGFPEGPDVRLGGRMSWLEALALLLSDSVVSGYPGLRPDFGVGPDGRGL